MMRRAQVAGTGSACELIAATDGAGHPLRRHKCYEGVTFGCDATRTAMWVAPKCTGLFRCGVRRLACGAQLPGREIDAFDPRLLTVADKRQQLVNCSCVHGATPAAGPWHAPRAVASAAAALPVRLEDKLAARRGWASRPCPGHFAGAAACGIERDEWMMVDALVQPADVVAEFGARFGTTSCRLARATNNSGRVVSFEPDTSVVPSLLRNRDANGCAFHVFNGVLSSGGAESFMRGGGSYGSRTGDVEFAGDPADKKLFAIPRLSLAQLEARLGARLSVALFDCEGCMPHVLSDELLARLRLILIEEDAYKRVKPRADGVHMVWRGVAWRGVAWRGLVWPVVWPGLWSGLSWQPSRQNPNSTPNPPHTPSLAAALRRPPPGAPALVDYAVWHARLRHAGFTRVWYAHDSFSSSAAWAKNLYHSAWARPTTDDGAAASSKPSPRCAAYKQRMGLSDRELKCVE